MRFKKYTLWIQKVQFLGFPHFPKIDPGYGPARDSLISFDTVRLHHCHAQHIRGAKIVIGFKNNCYANKTESGPQVTFSMEGFNCLN